MKILPSLPRTLRQCLTLLTFLAFSPLMQAQIVTNWVAYNDHRPGPTPPMPGQWGTALRVTTYDMGVSPGEGNLTNFLDGAQLPVTMAVSQNGSPDDFGTAFPPNEGTPAYNAFFGICDISNDGIVGVRFSSDSFVTLTFNNLDPEKRYLFRGTSARGGSYLLRWAVATITGVDGAIDASTSGVLTSNNFPMSLEPRQAAWNSGENRVGDLVGWDFINPGADGSFSIVCSNYVGQIPGGQADATRYGYSFGALLLAEVEASAAVITMNPTAETTVVQNRSFSLSVSATGTPLQYQWYKEGSGLIEGATFPTYTVANAALEDAGDYYVVVLNPIMDATSTVAHVTVNPDMAPPAVAAIFAYPTVDPSTRVATLDQITIEYDEIVDAASAISTANYEVPGGGNPVSVTLTNDQTVVLELAAPLSEDTDYSVTISGVSDIFENTIGSDMAAFHTWIAGPGNGLLFEAFDVGAGVETALLTNSPVFPDQPFFRTNLWAFDSRVAYPDNTQENYGSRTRGVFIPPVSGNWVFFLRTYDRGEFRINPNGLDPAGAIPILAEVTGNDPRDWDKFISAPLHLQAGNAYYIEGLQKAGAGTDVIKVAARLAGTGLPTLGVAETEIDPSSLMGAFIGTPLAPRDLGGPLTILEDLADFNAEEFHPITLSIPLDNPSQLPVVYQWYRDGSPIDGANHPSYTFQPTSVDSGATFRVETAKLGSTAVSRNATLLSVIPDTTPPWVEAVLSYASSLTSIQVIFNELMQDNVDINDAFNYEVDGVYPAAAQLGADGRTVTIDVNLPLTLGMNHEVAIYTGNDLAGNGLLPNPTIINFVAGSDSPGLDIRLNGTQAILSWPESAAGFALEETSALAADPATTVWTPVATAPVLIEGRYSVTVTVVAGTRIFRLRQ